MSGVDRRTAVESRVLVSGALAVGLPAGAFPPALASNEPGLVRPDGRRLVHEGHGSRTVEAAVTVNSGSRPRFRFTGGSVRAPFDVTSVTSPAQIHVSVDGGPKRLYAVDRSGLDRSGLAPGARVCNVQDGKVATTTPGVDFSIRWDGDRGSELLDHTHVSEWDPATESGTKTCDPAGVDSAARDATPFYDGDIVGDRREETLAETADHTAMRLCTTTEPTRTRDHPLAHNAAYRLGRTVRGHLQSTYTDHRLGSETRRIPRPAIARTSRTAPTQGAS
ncbi:hypothetical protein [Streptomyces sp. NBC_01314]|uniref:rhamnogalacturonan lyase family protein n=1 Tax=Streptomyces sp. NBC_01314 TaxID=2903821 RepID=UPI0030869FE4|nr:hypothetical protein OG622_09440 [Streptomyces sp. NBC_01314]